MALWAILPLAIAISRMRERQGRDWRRPALVGVVIAVGTYGLLRQSFNAAMDAVPDSVDHAEVSAFLAAQHTAAQSPG